MRCLSLFVLFWKSFCTCLFELCLVSVEFLTPHNICKLYFRIRMGKINNVTCCKIIEICLALLFVYFILLCWRSFNFFFSWMSITLLVHVMSLLTKYIYPVLDFSEMQNYSMLHRSISTYLYWGGILFILMTSVHNINTTYLNGGALLPNHAHWQSYPSNKTREYKEECICARMLPVSMKS